MRAIESDGGTGAAEAVAVAVPEHAPRARYALEVLLRLLGRRARDAGPREVPDVGYGLPARLRIPAGRQEGWDDPSPSVTHQGGVSAIRLDGPGEAGDGPIAFDVLYAAYACLTAPWEAGDPKDAGGCPLGGQGWLARNGLLREPLVHRYAELVGEALGLGRVERAATIVLTHDVDNNFGRLFGARERWELLRRDVRAGRPSAIRRLPGLARSLTARDPDPNDRFDDWADWHRSWGSRPAYFVASHGLFHPGADRRDVPYDVRRQEVRRMLRVLVAQGAEVGVHFSLGARESGERLRQEREALEDAIAAPVRSARHHWWALGTPAERTLRLQADAGIEVDCSLGFNDLPGFRRGIAAPFPPFDSATRTQPSILALPTIAMDAAVFDGRPVDEGVDDLIALYRTVRDVGGMLVLDWHVHAANPGAVNGAAEGLRRFLAQALEDGAALATPLEAIEKRLV